MGFSGTKPTSSPQAVQLATNPGAGSCPFLPTPFLLQSLSASQFLFYYRCSPFPPPSLVTPSSSSLNCQLFLCLNSSLSVISSRKSFLTALPPQVGLDMPPLHPPLSYTFRTQHLSHLFTLTITLPYAEGSRKHEPCLSCSTTQIPPKVPTLSIQ